MQPSHPLFDREYYLMSNPDVANTDGDPFIHFMTHGIAEGRKPNPFFDPKYYLERYPDVATAQENPLVHYLTHGAGEGHDPSPRFDTTWYLAQNPDVAESGVNPLVHFLEIGLIEGRRPHPSIPVEKIVEMPAPAETARTPPPIIVAVDLNLDAATTVLNSGLFDPEWYLKQNPDVAAAGVDPLQHYLSSGAHEGRNPGPRFDTSWYLARNPDVASAGANPLLHYLVHGIAEGRAAPPSVPQDAVSRLIGRYEEAEAVVPATLLRFSVDRLERHLDYFLPHRPINVFVDPRLSVCPSFNIVLPSVQTRHATGGPNVAYLLGIFLAREGIKVRFFSIDIPPDQDISGIKTHIYNLTGFHPDGLGIEFVDVSDRNVAKPIGYNDVLLATAWWTAHPAHAVAKFTRNKRIYYLIQDYETLFYAASENFADADATYSFDHYPIISGTLLRDHLASCRVGRFADPAFATSAAVIESAVQRTFFYPEPRNVHAPRRLLMYARPTIARRNLFGLGLAALRAGIREGLFDDASWEFLGMGEDFAPIPLGKGYELRPAPWLDFSGYAAQMRSSSVLLSLMLSPHPSFPPLEMAACGGLTVTTTYGSKTSERLGDYSSAIIGVPANVADLVAALSRALSMGDDDAQRRKRAEELQLPRSWDESFAPVVAAVLRELEKDGIRARAKPLPKPVTFVRADAEIERSPWFYTQRKSVRKRLYRTPSEAFRLSIVTTVYNTHASYIADLANSVLGQDTEQEFEWLILDNGSSDPETLQVLDQLSEHPRIRLGRVPDNLGIIGGMRWCLANARGKYILPVDSDDLLFPDALRTVSSYLEQAGFPSIAYTDEDKLEGDNHRDAYTKPGWDPVLFVHSCYIAHLTVIERETALKLGCYEDSRAEGSHDWDTFTRFFAAGHEPVHIPEILYSWRMHPGSTSGNFRSKDYIFNSQSAVLEKFLTSRGHESKYDVVSSPLFGDAPDWRFVRKKAQPFQSKIARVELRNEVDRAELAATLSQLPESDYIQLIATDCASVRADSIDEALALFELFPDTTMIGGRIHDGRTILEAGYVFGYAGGIACPDFGRSLSDAGYFAQMWKPHSVAAVSARLCFVEREFLKKCIETLPETITLSSLGPWLGALARRGRRRVVYSPFVEGQTSTAKPLSDVELTMFNARFGELSLDDVGYPRHLDRSGLAPFKSAAGEAKPRLLSYREYSQLVISDRRKSAHGTTKQVSTVSILTTVYSRTDTEQFRSTVGSVEAQIVPPLEWVVLAHGPVSVELDAVLRDLAERGAIRLLHNEVNLGITGGLRYCLERAKGDFAVALDADDLLTPDALALLTQAATAHPAAAVIYSDEDIITDGEPRDAFHRPDFDPALLLSHSYVWHSILFRRELALELGVFTSSEAEYAQDWDLMVRFMLAGHEIVHLAEVTYHWRRHQSSISNSGKVHQGSLDSVKAVLGFIKRNAKSPDLYEVASYPLDTGMPDFYLRRLPDSATEVSRICLGDGVHASLRFPFKSNRLREAAGISSLVAALKAIDSEIVLLSSAAIEGSDDEGLWQALKHIELVQTCVAVSGALVGPNGKIVRGTPVQLDSTTLIDPLFGKSVKYNGQFSIPLKPHCVSALSVDLLLVRRDFLVAALANRPTTLSLRNLGLWLGVFAEAHRQHLVFEPLFRGHVARESALVGGTVEGLCVALRHLPAQTKTSEKTRIRGVAGFEFHKMRYAT